MTSNPSPRFVLLGGLSGIIGTICYIAAVTVPAGQTLSYVFVMTWPVLSIVFIYALTRYVGAERQSAASHLALVFGCLSFAMVAAMISIQLAVRIGIEEYITEATGGTEETLKLIRRSVRLVDLGLDVAWDVFIGTTLLFLAAALMGHSRFGYWWGIPSAMLGLLLIGLNVATFPWPPDTRGLFDVGPVIGVYIIVLSARFFVLGLRMHRAPGS